MGLAEFDCSRRTRRPILEIGHDSNGVVAYQIHHEELPRPVKAQPVAPDTLGEIDMKAICALPPPKR